ncbi:NACHT domain-containing NTPase [Corallococcus sp. CA041A]|uniref:NACHT domain-containing protein n=1 Tax=Corallococcus sp. CA041A TaxID=2316727 RepID=UPI0011C3D1D3|nr:NACHT domain-containing protein [Corallococcus sp. CA041A]
MSGTIEDQFVEQSAAVAFQLITSSIKSISTLLSDKNAVQQGMQKYARNFLERYGDMKVLNMDEPIPIREIYVAAQALSPRTISNYRSIDELQLSFQREGKKRLPQGTYTASKRDCLDLANEEQFLNVLGAPGAGKSTFLRRLGLEALLPRRTWTNALKVHLGIKPGLSDEANSRYTHDHLPVLIELRRFRTEEIDLGALVADEIAVCGLPESKELTTALLAKGQLLLLFDGVDEIPGDRLDAAIAHIRDFIDKHSRNRFVISCRTAFYKNFLTRFTDVLLADFDDKQISTFVRGWFRSENDKKQNTAGEFLRLINDPENISSKELANTPLLLTFLCLAFDETMRLPPNRSELYRQALEILLFRWANNKRVHNNPIYRDLHPSLEVGMLTEIAAPAFKADRYFFNRRELTEAITQFLKNELQAPKQIDSDLILEAIEIQQGLLVQRAQDAWSFSHLTLQEYLTACWHVQNKKILEAIKLHITDARWREVFILIAGLEGKADFFLAKMTEAASGLANQNTHLKLTLTWALTHAQPASDSMRTAAHRAFAITLLRDYTTLSSLVNAILEPNTIDRAQALTKTVDRHRSYNHLWTRELATSLDPDSQSTVDFAPVLIQAPEGDTRIAPNINGQALLACGERLMATFSRLAQSNLLIGDWTRAASDLMVVLKPVREASTPNELAEHWSAVRSTYSSALGLPAQLKTWNGQAPVFEQYLQVCRLILDCKSAATRVTRSAWDSIADCLFSGKIPPKVH